MYVLICLVIVLFRQQCKPAEGSMENVCLAKTFQHGIKSPKNHHQKIHHQDLFFPFSPFLLIIEEMPTHHQKMESHRFCFQPSVFLLIFGGGGGFLCSENLSSGVLDAMFIALCFEN